MDMDVILLKPLDSLHNAIGSEILANGEVRLNGAVMVFNKSRSVFDHAILQSCSLWWALGCSHVYFEFTDLWGSSAHSIEQVQSFNSTVEIHVGWIWWICAPFVPFCSPFLRECLEEFTATYDDTLLEWNGAELVTRVANFSIRKGGKKWSEDPEALQIQPPFAFFPLTSSSILRYDATFLCIAVHLPTAWKSEHLCSFSPC